MQLIRHNPLSLMNGLRHDMDRLILNPTLAASGDRDQAWLPNIDISEEKDRFVIQADVPGVAPDDLEITFEDGVLTLEGERKLARDEDQDNFHRIERARGSFLRRFQLPETASAEGLDASYRDGVLTISIPKQAKPEPVRIRVSAN